MRMVYVGLLTCGLALVGCDDTAGGDANNNLNDNLNANTNGNTNTNTLADLAPDLLSPADGATAVDTALSQVTAQFSGAGNLVNPVIRQFRADDDTEVAGTTVVSGDSLDTALFAPDSPLDDGTEYYFTLTADSITKDGVLYGVDFGSNKTDWNITSSSGPDYILYVDFDRLPDGTLYTEDEVDTDFRARADQPNNKSIGVLGDATFGTRIVADPEGLRGNVLRSRYEPGTTGARMGWRDHFSRTNQHLIPVAGSRVADYPKSAWLESPENGGNYAPGRPPGEPGEMAETRANDPTQRRYDELYFAVDMYLDPDWENLPYHKLWGIGEGSPRQASHGIYGCPSEEGYYGLLVWVLLTGREWNTSGDGSDGSMAMYLYETDRAFQTLWLNRNDPTNQDKSTFTGGNADFYYPPRGQWFTIEVRSKLNDADDVWKDINETSGSCRRPASPSQDLSNGTRDDTPSAGDLPNGILEVWITDPRPVSQGGTDGIPHLMMQKTDCLQRHWDHLKYGHFSMRDWNNNNSNTNQYLPTQQQDLFFDRIRVSTQFMGN